MESLAVTINGKEYLVQFLRDGSVQINGEAFHADIQPAGSSSYSLLVQGKQTRMVAQSHGNGFHVLVNSQMLDVKVETERALLKRRYHFGNAQQDETLEIHAPMPALVVRIEVKEGEFVDRGQGLLALEAMKMENEINAVHEGIVKNILVRPGQAVEKGELFMVLE